MSNDALAQTNYPGIRERRLRAVEEACNRTTNFEMKMFWKRIKLKIK